MCSIDQFNTGAVEVLAQIPSDKISVGIHTLCALQAKSLTQVSTQVVYARLSLSLSQLVQSNTQVQNGTLNDPAIWMDRLAEIFRACDFRVGPTGHPCQEVVVEVSMIFISETQPLSLSLAMAATKCCDLQISE